MSQAGCYVLDLNCDHPRHDVGWPRHAQFTGRTEREAMAAARAAGWLVRVHADNCPVCMDKYESPPKTEKPLKYGPAEGEEPLDGGLSI